MNTLLPDLNTNSLVFKMSSRQVWVTTLKLSLLVFLLILHPSNFTQGNLPAIFISFSCGLCAGLGMSLAYIRMYPVVLNTDELRWTNAWGKWASVRWPEISSIERIHFMTLPYLKISTSQKKNVIWLPLFLKDINGFRAAVAGFTPPDNPLRVALEC